MGDGKWIDAQHYVEEVLESAVQSPAIDRWEIKRDSETFRLEVITGDGDVWDLGPEEATAFCAGLDLGLYG